MKISSKLLILMACLACFLFGVSCGVVKTKQEHEVIFNELAQDEVYNDMVMYHYRENIKHLERCLDEKATIEAKLGG